MEQISKHNAMRRREEKREGDIPARAACEFLPPYSPSSVAIGPVITNPGSKKPARNMITPETIAALIGGLTGGEMRAVGCAEGSEEGEEEEAVPGDAPIVLAVILADEIKARIQTTRTTV